MIAIFIIFVVIVIAIVFVLVVKFDYFKIKILTEIFSIS